MQIYDNLEICRDLVVGLRESYNSRVSDKINQIINLLMIISTIFIPLSFLTGLYRMNFNYMPEFQKPWDYPILLIVMTSISTFML